MSQSDYIGAFDDVERVEKIELAAAEIPFPDAKYLGHFDLLAPEFAGWLRTVRPGLPADILLSQSMPGGSMRTRDGQPRRVPCYAGCSGRSVFVFPQGFSSKFADRTLQTTRVQIVIDAAPDQIPTSQRPWGAANTLTPDDLRMPFFADGELLVRVAAEASPDVLASLLQTRKVALCPRPWPAGDPVRPFLVYCDTEFGLVLVEDGVLLSSPSIFWKEPTAIQLTPEKVLDLFKLFQAAARVITTGYLETWLQGSNRLLAGRSPIDCVLCGAQDRVMQMLYELTAGIPD